MAPSPIKCAAELPGGNKCKELATVTSVQYVYDRNPVVGAPNQYILKEIQYRAVCPKCGDRIVVEPASP